MITPYACQLAPQMTRDHESSDWKNTPKDRTLSNGTCFNVQGMT